MPIAIVLALAASLGIHAAALFGPDVELFGGADEPLPLRAELQPRLPAPPGRSRRVETKAAARRQSQASGQPRPPAAADAAPMQPEPELSAAAETTAPGRIDPVPPEPARPLLPANGVIRFAIFMGSQGFQIGRAEHRWEFTEDGRYHLFGMTETSGLVGLFKPVRFENESRGRLVAGGLQPEHYLTRKNGKDANENAEFDWSATQVRLSRDGQTRPVAPGTQDILSLNYHLAYVRQPSPVPRLAW
jgi:hypothetical protein